MDEQIQSTIPTEVHSHKGLYTIIAFSLGTVAILFVIVMVMVGKQTGTAQPRGQIRQYQPVQTPRGQTQQALQNQIQQVTPQPINTKQNLNEAMQTLDSTDMSQISTGITRNSQDTSSFSQ
ncbi:hypothetical protein M1615_05165 [Patescibacteria group bacterium]|nr:hypothetical protein [Patescibacteria group bacterium]MCL5010036.1 hypothetical protein [Patescibacteria group bacterium]